MRVSFVRTRGARDRIYATRDDGTEVSWSFPTYGDALPHDMVHLVVESILGLRQGFWGRVAAGLDPARVNAMVNREGGGNRNPGFGSDKRELYLAEALAALPWSDPERNAASLIAAVAEGCRAAGEPVLEVEQVDEVRRRLAELGERWRAIGEKGAIELRWPMA